MAFAMPITVFSWLVYAGYFGIVAGMWVRRGKVIFVAVVGLVLMLGLCNAPYLALGFEPGLTVARLGAIRMMLLVRPFMFAAAAYTFTVLGGRAKAAWQGAPRRKVLVGAALAGVVLGSLVRVLPEYWRTETDRVIEEARQFAPDPAGRAALTAWAREQMKTIGPGAWARALFDEDTHEHFHLTAETGLPTLHLSPIPDLLLRERIENATPESLKRFDVRWIVSLGRAPVIGDPATEKVFGTYHIRELAEWDGQFARIERGTGSVKTVRLDDEAVEIEVTAPGPVLVALGTGFYPRWQARTASGIEEPVYALPSTPDSTLHVVSAWVQPGRTIFTCDGPLPSDGHGRVLSLVAALAGAAGVIVWSRRRWRLAVLRVIARLLARKPVAISWLRDVGVPAVVVVLFVRGCVALEGRTPALLVGSGVRASAQVEARVAGGQWQTCNYSPLAGHYRCDGLVTVADGTVNMLNDAPPSWAFVSPSIDALADRDPVELKITMDAHLAGRYWVGVSYSSATLRVGDEGVRELGTHGIEELDDHGVQPVVLMAHAPVAAVLHISMTAEDTLVPPRPFLAGPPAAAP
jgi:hypothetical protein